jgi:hypothetical protein
MSWSATGASKIFRAYVADIIANTTAMDLDGTDSLKAALYNDTTTPDQNATSALSAYNAGTSPWVVANEVSQAGQWAAGGVALGTPVVNSGSAGIVFFDAADTASGAAATLAAVFGCLVYDDTIAAPVAKQGICYNYFGGSQSVTAGTFTIIWHANGIFRLTL